MCRAYVPSPYMVSEYSTRSLRCPSVSQPLYHSHVCGTRPFEVVGSGLPRRGATPTSFARTSGAKTSRSHGIQLRVIRAAIAVYLYACHFVHSVQLFGRRGRSLVRQALKINRRPASYGDSTRSPAWSGILHVAARILCFLAVA